MSSESAHQSSSCKFTRKPKAHLLEGANGTPNAHLWRQQLFWLPVRFRVAHRQPSCLARLAVGILEEESQEMQGLGGSGGGWRYPGEQRRNLELGEDGDPSLLHKEEHVCEDGDPSLLPKEEQVFEDCVAGFEDGVIECNSSEGESLRPKPGPPQSHARLGLTILQNAYCSVVQNRPLGLTIVPKAKPGEGGGWRACWGMSFVSLPTFPFRAPFCFQGFLHTGRVAFCIWSGRNKPKTFLAKKN